MTHLSRTSSTLSQSPRSSRRLMSRACCCLQTRTSLLPPAEQLKLQDAIPPTQLIAVPRRISGTDRACVDELSSSDVLDITVFNLGNLARQTIQHQAEPRTLRLIMNQTSHSMMLVEGTSLTANQWDKKLRAPHWSLCSSDDGHHWVGVRKAENVTTIRQLVDR